MITECSSLAGRCSLVGIRTVVTTGGHVSTCHSQEVGVAAVGRGDDSVERSTIPGWKVLVLSKSSLAHFLLSSPG